MTEMTPRITTEPHTPGRAGRMNWLRAGVLGADDGIVSVAGIVVGVAGATSSRGAIFTAGMAGLVAGAVSMALGEYVSVSSQRDSEHAMIDLEKQEIAESPAGEELELAAIYRTKGLTATTASTVAAAELMAHDALAAHLDAELNLDPDDTASPAQAAAASAFAFTLGALLPLLAMMLSPESMRVPVTVVAVLLALGATGAASARIGGSRPRIAVLRIVLGGAAGLAFTYAVGHFFGTAIG
ncbi:MAG TPA: VIT family protein [Candidatus Nanopelagicales bacterium]